MIMRQQLETLQKKLQIVEKFEHLFASQTTLEFNQRLGSKETEGSFVHYMQSSAVEKTAAAFDDFKFNDARSNITNYGLQKVKELTTRTPKNADYLDILDQVNNANRVFHFFNFAITLILRPAPVAPKTPPNDIFSAVTNLVDSLLAVQETQNPLDLLKTCIQDLISAQKKAIQIEIDATEAEAKKAERKEKMPGSAEKIRRLVKNKSSIAKKNPAVIAAKDELSALKHNKAEAEATAAFRKAEAEATAAFRKKALRYTGAATLATTGAAVTTFSALMQFNPQFALLVGMHLPPVALVSIAVTGLTMVAAAAFVAYRTYNPAPAVFGPAPEVVATNYSRFLTPALMTTGLGLASFSALTQFSPQFALLVGLNMSPAALITMAAVGTLLVSVALFRMCKARMQARAEGVAPDPVAIVPQETTTCAQRFAKYVPSCCFGLFANEKPAASAKPTAQEQKFTEVLDRISPLA